MNAVNAILAFLGLATITQATRDNENRVIIDPDAHTRVHVWG
jgi:hypothetical protein